MSQHFSGQPLLLQYFLTAGAVYMGLIYSKTELGFTGSNVVLSGERIGFCHLTDKLKKIHSFQSPPSLSPLDTHDCHLTTAPPNEVRKS